MVGGLTFILRLWKVSLDLAGLYLCFSCPLRAIAVSYKCIEDTSGETHQFSLCLMYHLTIYRMF